MSEEYGARSHAEVVVERRSGIISRDLQVTIESATDIVTARQRGRELAASIGFSGTDRAVIALVISELARNVVDYAKRGRVTLRRLDEVGRCGIQIVATDEGPGIADIERALRGGSTVGKSPGIGLPGTRWLMDEFDLSSALSKGTTIATKKWLR